MTAHANAPSSVISAAHAAYIVGMKETSITPTVGEKKFTTHRFDMNDRKKAALTGVTRVESSNDTEILLSTCLGRMEIRGTGFKISRFDVDSGELTFTGDIVSVKYVEAKPPLLKRIFK